MRIPNRHSRCFRWILILVAGGLGFVAHGDAASEFEEANRLYEQGRYVEATLAYQQLIERVGVSPALYFNLGNALFRSGQVGRAIHSYRLAERQAPRDPDIQANLQFVRNTVSGGSSRHETIWRRCLSRLTLDEWSLWTAVGLWIWMGLLTLRQWPLARTSLLRVSSWIAGGATGLAVICLAAAWHSQSASATAIVIVPETIVHYGPYEESPSHYVARDGTELEIIDVKDDWMRVVDGAQRIGWLKQGDVLAFP